MTNDTEAERRSILRENPPHLAKLDCGHIQRFVGIPVIEWYEWYEWCSMCGDFSIVLDGV